MLAQLHVLYCCRTIQITRFDGHGKISGANKVTVVKGDNSEEAIATKNILIATGSEVTPFPGIEVRISLAFTEHAHVRFVTMCCVAD